MSSFEQTAAHLFGQDRAMTDLAGYAAKGRADAQPGDFPVDPVAIVAHDGVMIGILTALMQDEGYFVLSAADCQEALCLSRTYPGAIDVLLTDGRMPRLVYTDLCSHLLAERPGIKVVVMLCTEGYGAVSSRVAPRLAPRDRDEQRLKEDVRAILAAPAQSAPYVYVVFTGTPLLAARPGCQGGGPGVSDRQYANPPLSP
jgi:CheY-like chemotaxis protein